MDYSDDACVSLFTQDQITLMRRNFEERGSSVSILSSNELIPTGPPVCIDPCPGKSTLVKLTINLDDFPTDTNWELKNSSSIIVASGDSYGFDFENSMISKDFCLPEGCYNFIIYDEFGDGSNTLENIAYTLTYEYGVILVTGLHRFSNTVETTNFCVEINNQNDSNYVLFTPFTAITASINPICSLVLH